MYEKFAFSVVVFCSHAETYFWFLLLFLFFGSHFFLYGFPNPFIVHSRPSFLFVPSFHFSLVVFVHMRQFNFDFYSFQFLDRIFSNCFSRSIHSSF